MLTNGRAAACGGGEDKHVSGVGGWELRDRDGWIREMMSVVIGFSEDRQACEQDDTNRWTGIETERWTND